MRNIQFNVVWPVCVETKTDVFLIILKKIVGRSMLDDHYLVSALKSGMSEGFTIESEDLSVDWTKLDSESQQIRQWKLLGLWAVKNFPSLGKKLFGESYRVPQRSAVPVNGNSACEADSLDEFIFPKMKLRNVELNVYGSTMIKFKHFTRVPAVIGKSNEQRLSRKIKLFDVDDEFVERCWKALKSGEFSSNSEFEVSYPAFSFDSRSLSGKYCAWCGLPKIQCLNKLKS